MPSQELCVFEDDRLERKDFLTFLIDRNIPLESEFFPHGVVAIASRGSLKLLIIVKQVKFRTVTVSSLERERSLITVHFSFIAGALSCSMCECLRQTGDQEREHSIARLLPAMLRVTNVH